MGMHRLFHFMERKRGIRRGSLEDPGASPVLPAAPPSAMRAADLQSDLANQIPLMGWKSPVFFENPVASALLSASPGAGGDGR